jgi:hypothetical protein
VHINILAQRKRCKYEMSLLLDPVLSVRWILSLIEINSHQWTTEKPLISFTFQCRQP